MYSTWKEILRSEEDAAKGYSKELSILLKQVCELGKPRTGWCCLMLQNLLLPCFTLVEHYLLTHGQIQASNVSTLTFCPFLFSHSAAAPKQVSHKYIVKIETVKIGLLWHSLTHCHDLLGLKLVIPPHWLWGHDLEAGLLERPWTTAWFC